MFCFSEPRALAARTFFPRTMLGRGTKERDWRKMESVQDRVWHLTHDPLGTRRMCRGVTVNTGPHSRVIPTALGQQ